MKSKIDNKKTLVVAEMACSHEGDISLAKKIIDSAAYAGSDVIQLQIWSLKYMMTPNRKEYDLLKDLEFDKKQWTDIVNYSRDLYPRMQIYVCAYEHSTIEFIDSLGVDGYKINSSDLSNYLVLEKIANTGKPINLSVGASSLAEIQYAIDQIKSDSKITLMYGHQSFPTRPEDINLSFINELKKRFKLPIGYQDHCDAEDDSAFWLPATGLGYEIDIIEKHLTHDRSKKGIDHESALNPDEFVKFVKMIRIIDKAKGISLPRPFTKQEIRYREFQKKSIVLSKNISKGSIISSDDITFMRAEKLGLPPNKANLVIGKSLLKDSKAFELILLDDVS